MNHNSSIKQFDELYFIIQNVYFLAKDCQLSLVLLKTNDVDLSRGSVKINPLRLSYSSKQT